MKRTMFTLKCPKLNHLIFFGSVIFTFTSLQAYAGFLDDLKSDLKNAENKAKSSIEKLKNPGVNSSSQPGSESNRNSTRKNARSGNNNIPTAQPTYTTPTQNQPSAQTEKANSSETSIPGIPWTLVSEPFDNVYGFIDDNAEIAIKHQQGQAQYDNNTIYYGGIFATGGFFTQDGQEFPCTMYFKNFLKTNREDYAKNKTIFEAKIKQQLGSNLSNLRNLTGKFVKLDGVRKVIGTIDKIDNCLYSTISESEVPPKTNARFTLRNNASQQFLNRAKLNGKGGTFFLPRGINYLPNTPDHMKVTFHPTFQPCGYYAWSSSRNLKSVLKRLDEGEFDNINAAEIELTGVRVSTLLRSLCEVDSIKVRKL